MTPGASPWHPGPVPSPAARPSRILVALVSVVCLGISTWLAFHETARWLEASTREGALQRQLLAELRARNGTALDPQQTVPPGLVAWLEAGTLEVQGRRALQAVLADPEPGPRLGDLFRELALSPQGALPEDRVIFWAGLEARGEFLPPEKLQDFSAAVRHTRRWPEVPGGVQVAALWISWLSTLALLLGLARAFRSPRRVRRHFGPALGLTLVPCLASLGAAGVSLAEGSTLTDHAPLILLGWLSQSLAWGTVAACGLSLVSRRDAGAPLRLSIPGAILGGLLLACLTVTVQAAFPWGLSPEALRGESLRMVFGLPAPSLWTQGLSVLAAALGEELVYRLLLLAAALRVLPRGWAVALVTTLWVLPHLIGVVPLGGRPLLLGLAGWILAEIRLRYGVATSGLAHGLWNLAAVCCR